MKLLEVDKRNLGNYRYLNQENPVVKAKNKRYEKTHTKLLGTSFDIDHY